MKYNNIIIIKTDYQLINIFIKIAIISILTIILSLKIFYINNSNKLKLNNEKNKNSYNYEDASKIKGINYLKMCLNYLNKTKTSLNFNIFNFKLNIYRKIPKITVIIPVYNCQN